MKCGKIWTVGVVGLLLGMTQSVQANIYATNDTQLANLKIVEEWTENEDKATRHRSDWAGYVNRALRVDLDAKEVVVLAELCDISAASTIEFPICGERSDRDYESLFRTFAEPGAIAQALENLGVSRGKNVNYREMNLWAQGDRVTVEVAPFGATNEVYTPIQRYITDREKKNYLDFSGFIYCGSLDDPQAKKAGTRLCDSEAPNSVLSTYNERQTVLDMPIFCPQSSVYERFRMAEDADLKPFGLYKIRFRPLLREDGKGTARYCGVRIRHNDAVGIGYDVKEKEQGEVFTNSVEMVEYFHKMVKSGLDAFVSISFSDDLTLNEAKEQAAIFNRIDGDDGVRVIAPMSDSIFYKGFLPNERWREVEYRPTQPWVLRFGGEGETEGAGKIVLIKTDEDWTSSDSLDPILTTTDFVASSAEEADQILKANDKDPLVLGVLLVFAPGDAPLSLIMPTLRLVKERYSTIYVFPDAKPLK